MSFSNLGVFSDNQSLVASAASTNSVDLATTRQQIGAGVPVYICIRVGTAFAAATSYQFDLQNADDVNFSGGDLVTYPLRGAIAIASLSAGAWVYRGPIPYECSKRHIQLYYTEAGSTENAGTVDAWLSLKPPTDYGANAQVWVSPVGNP